MPRDLTNPIVDLLDAAIKHRCVRLDCPRCNRVAILDGHAVWWLFHRKRWPIKMRFVAQRFRCSTCYRRYGEHVRPRLLLVEQRPTIDDLPQPDPREWKLALSRRR